MNRSPSGPTLEDLARQRFGVLTPAELGLVRAAPQGAVAICSPNPGNPAAPDNDPSNASSWGSARGIRADVVRWICVDADASMRVDPNGIQIYAALIVGKLDLSFVSVGFPLAFRNCRFSADMHFVGANLMALFLDGSRVSVLVANGVQISRSVFLRSGFIADGAIELVSADIRGDLDCSNGHFNNAQGHALSADRARIGGGVVLRDGFTAEGEVRLLAAVIATDLDCTNGRFKNRNTNRPALNGDGVKIGGSVLLNGFSAEGEVRFIGADIRVDLSCAAGKFRNTGGIALGFDGASIRGAVQLMECFSAEGEVRLVNSHVGGHLDCTNATFKNPPRKAPDGAVIERKALVLDGAIVEGNVFFQEGFYAEGEVSLIRAKITHDLACPNSHFKTPGAVAMSADGVQVGGNVYFTEGFIAEGQVRLPNSMTSGNLECSKGCFKNPGSSALYGPGAEIKGGVAFDNLTTEGGVVLNTAKIGGHLNCAGARVEGEMILDSARIGGHLHCPGAVFRNCDKLALVADGINVGAIVHLGDRFCADGEVRLLNAVIGRQFYCAGGRFKNPNGVALRADGVTAGSGVYLTNGFSAEGVVQLHNARIKGDLDCSKACLKNPGLDALVVNGATIDGFVGLTGGFLAEGQVSFVAATISGNLNCSHGTFKNPDKIALIADGIIVRGHVLLTKHFEAEGQVRLLGANIQGTLDCNAGIFKNPKNTAMLLDHAKVGGSVRLGEGFNADGEVRLNGIEISSALEIVNTDLTGTAVVAQGARVSGPFIFRDVRALATLDMVAAAVCGLADDVKSWPSASGVMKLNGFTYDRILRPPTDAKTRLQWLRRSSSFARQPYQHLAKVLREQGDDLAARTILIAMEEEHRKHVAVPWYEWLWAEALKRTIRYGYEPLHVLLGIAWFVLIGFLVFGIAYRVGAMVPADKDAFQYFDKSGYPPANYEPFCAIVYSLDTFLPLVSLQQKDRWVPRGSIGKAPRYSNSNLLTRVICDGSIPNLIRRYLPPTNTLQRYITPGPVRAYRWIHIAIGWFFAAMLVAGVTGLTKRG